MRSLIVLAALWMNPPADAGKEVTADQLARLIQAQAAPLEDIAFLYEGELRWVGPRRVLKRDPDSFGRRFQGAYLYRKIDGAALMDVFAKSLQPTSPLFRRKVSHLRGEVERYEIRADKRHADPDRDIQKGRGDVLSLNGAESANPLFGIGRLLLIEHPGDWGYEFQGWEDVEGRPCLRFRINRVPDKQKGTNYRVYWIDTERGAHPLRTDNYWDGKLKERIDQVKLAAVDLEGGKRYWVPVHCRLSGFDWEDSFYDEPVQEESIDVVSGTILVNQGLPDAIFSVRRTSGLPLPGELERLRRTSAGLELSREFEAIPPRPSPRTDPAGVRERLDRKLAEADRQAEELQASSPARQKWSWTASIQVGTAIAGVCLIAVALYRRRAR